MGHQPGEFSALPHDHKADPMTTRTSAGREQAIREAIAVRLADAEMEGYSRHLVPGLRAALDAFDLAIHATPDTAPVVAEEPLTADEQIELIRRSLAEGLVLDRFAGSVPIFRRPIAGPDMGTERSQVGEPPMVPCVLCAGKGRLRADVQAERVAALSAEPMSSEVANNETALDVERLARVADAYAGGRVTLTRGTAPRIAAEYDRLAVRDDEEPRT